MLDPLVHVGSHPKRFKLTFCQRSQNFFFGGWGGCWVNLGTLVLLVLVRVPVLVLKRVPHLCHLKLLSSAIEALERQSKGLL